MASVPDIDPNTAPIAVTMGEPAGIGGELTLKAWMDGRKGEHPAPVFFAIDDDRRLGTLARQLGWEVPIETIAAPDEARAVWPTALPVLAEPLPCPVAPGAPAVENAPAVIGAIERAVECAASGAAAAIVTNPIHKENLYRSGFSHTGHTDFLGHLAQKQDMTGGAELHPVMMMATPGLRVALVTVHVPLAQAIRQLDEAAIVRCVRIVARDLDRRFKLPNPNIAVAGLNPHAGEGGMLGREEKEIIGPALETLAAEGIVATGPLAADTVFRDTSRQQFDAIVCMYHDQALIPVKALDFRHTVNITLGLPFIRTSPGHGTGLDIAGTGRADPTSFVTALAQAAELSRNVAEGGTV
ncbi:MAG: 4-hydroxythreonine-4-phosphate dehydrogenase PdxA [Alphaproteobacteria bacterium]|nr:4-hydroxythreonine-4-phosphate dehydrogenase PdxA [Alphaproteobacteria bacterium]